MGKQKTAMQQAIEKINELFNQDGHLICLKVEDALKELLPVEREQFEHAWIAGNLSMDERFKDRGLAQSPTDYFINTYKTE